MKKRLQMFTKIVFAALSIVGLANRSNAQCIAGEVAVSIDVTTDTWGYEGYWELVPTGAGCGTASTIFAGGNTIVGCSGGGAVVAAAGDPGSYANSSLITEGPFCLTIGSQYDIIMVDDYGDGGTNYSSTAQGINVTMAGTNQTYTFTALTPFTDDLQSLSVSGAEYSLIPVDQIDPAGISLTASVKNNGVATVADAVLTVNVYIAPNPTPVQTTSSAASAISSSATAVLSAGTYLPSAIGQYVFEYIASAASITDGNPANDTIYYTMLVTDSVYARDNASITGIVTGTLGIGGGAGELGQDFTIFANDTMTAVDAFIGNTSGGMNGKPFSVKIYNTDAIGTPTTLIATTDVITIDTTTNKMWSLPITGGLALAPGEYAVLAQEIDTNISLGTTTGIFTAGKTWVIFGTNPWANSETYGFSVSYVLRPIFGGNGSVGIDELATPSFSIYPNPATENILVNNLVNGSTLEIMNALGQVVYTETVNNMKSNINVVNFNNGVYMVRINNGKEVITNTFVKQ